MSESRRPPQASAKRSLRARLKDKPINLFSTTQNYAETSLRALGDNLHPSLGRDAVAPYFAEISAFARVKATELEIRESS
jgi:hypothetical protein